MRTNLIQSYLSGNTTAQQYNSEKAAKDFDVKKELANRTFIKPLPSNGKLLKPSLFDMPSVFVKDVKYDWNAFRHAVKGEANDHELGRLNDAAMKLGGLTIASYLFTKKQTPMTKAFEFVGLCSFFGAMDLWPKLFLQLPAYLIHGFDIRQKYEDNYGRKKLVFQDHQFIPWDLYSDREINKIGDRLRIPKDIPNRREYIQEKMRKIALQNNTMWMLTAGFATPILSALICNALEKPIAGYLDQKNNKKADELLVNFTEEIGKFDFSKKQEALDVLLAENNGKPITSDLIDSIHSNITDGWDPVVAASVRMDLENMLDCSGKYKISNETMDALTGVIKETFAKIPLTEDELAKIIPDKDSIINALNSKNLLGVETKDFSEHSKVIQDLLDDRVTKFIEENPSNPNAKKLDFLVGEMVHSGGQIGADSPLGKVFKLEPAAVLTKQMQEALKGVSTTLDNLQAKNIVLDRYIYIKSAQAPETILANSWNNTTEALLKVMNFTPEEIKQARFDREIAGEILRNKMEEIVADRETYGKFVAEMENLLSELHSRSSSIELQPGAVDENDKNLFRSLINSSCDEAAESLRKAGMINSAESIVGFDANAETSLKGLLLNFGTDRVRGVKSSFYRILDLADLYYKVAHVEGLDDILDGKMLREVKEEAVELAKQTLLEGHTSDFAVKFYQKRNLNPQKDDYTQIEAKGGKVINKYFGTHEPVDLAEMSNDKNFFEKVMKLMFGSELHKDTYDKIKNSAILEDFKSYRGKVLHYIGSDFYFAKPNHVINETRLENTPSEYKFALMGCAPDEMFFNLFNNKFNSWKWFNIFGKLGAGLIGVTLLSQFFMGRMKKPEQMKEAK